MQDGPLQTHREASTDCKEKQTECNLRKMTLQLGDGRCISIMARCRHIGRPVAERVAKTGPLHPQVYKHLASHIGRDHKQPQSMRHTVYGI